MRESSILLDTGTGEVEVIVFTIHNVKYCINVLKTKEIIRLEDITPTDIAKKSIIGITNIRGSIMSVIDLKYVLHEKHSAIANGEGSNMALICQFNNQQVVFLVDEIEGIQRVRWDDIQPPQDILEGTFSVGNIIKDERILIMLDFEKIVTDLCNEKGANPYYVASENVSYVHRRHDKKIYLAEDSYTIREMLKGILTEAGYQDIHIYENGQDVINAIFELKQTYGNDFNKHIDLLITDIEMPKLDGHSVVKKIKEDECLKTLPVIIFSSLITEDLYHKGVSVNADCQVSKPTLDKLIDSMDKLLFASEKGK